MSTLKLNQLEMLVAVADAGSFGGAAAELGCTQSRISHAITELEHAVGVRLLSRSRTGCVATDAGQRVLRDAREVMRLTAGMLDTARASAALSGQVRVACFRSIGTHLLPDVLAALAIEYPGIHVDIDDSCEERDDVTRAVLEGRAELGIAQLPVDDALVAHPYLCDAYVLVVPAGLPLRSPMTWDQLHALPYIQLDCAGAFAILEKCRAAGFKAEPSRTLSSDTSIAAMVGHGVGYAILPRLAVFPQPAGVAVVDLPIPARRAFAVVALPGTGRGKAVQAVIRFIRNKRLVSQSAAWRAGLVAW
jgi:DNA-binding transcriptional LysR family regulator